MRTLIPASGQLLKGLVRYYTLCRCHKSDQFMSGMLDQHHHTYTVCKKWSLYSLPSRGLVGLRGIDVIPFLQGLITNDVSKLGNLGSSSKSMYAMMLNVQGRVMYDILIHNSQNDTIPSVILEVDRSVVQDVIKTLKKYKIRKKVDIYDVSGERQVFATVALEIPDSNVSWLPLNGTDIIANPDPRLEKFGWRIVAPDETYIRSNLDSDVSLVLGDEVEYHIARYKLGIPEGTEDLPPGDCLPLESNIVYHNGVSFTKGCYIGQELTARTHHTGVTRKRIIPLQFDIAPVNIVPGSSILTASGKSAGKFRSARDVYGLGLVRLSYIKDILKVTSQGGDIYTTRTVIPTWWPQDIAANKL